MRLGHPRIPIDIGQVTGCTCVRVEIPTPDTSTSLQGTYTLILTTPNALKVDGITPWVHYIHVRPADPHAVLKDFVPEWKSQLDKDNPLKLRLRRSHLFPTSKTP